MKATTVLAILIATLMLAACGELLPTEPVTSVSPTMTSTDTRATLDHRGVPSDPIVLGFRNVELRVVGESRLKCDWTWVGERPKRFGIFEVKEGGFEPNPEFSVPGDQTTFEYASWPWYQPTVRLAVAAQVVDADGTIRWTFLTMSNEVTEPRVH
jgi:hypothetical protein